MKDCSASPEFTGNLSSTRQRYGLDLLRDVPELMLQMYSFLTVKDRLYTLSLVDRSFAHDIVRSGVLRAADDGGSPAVPFSLRDAFDTLHSLTKCAGWNASGSTSRPHWLVDIANMRKFVEGDCWDNRSDHLTYPLHQLGYLEELYKFRKEESNPSLAPSFTLHLLDASFEWKDICLVTCSMCQCVHQSGVSVCSLMGDSQPMCNSCFERIEEVTFAKRRVVSMEGTFSNFNDIDDYSENDERIVRRQCEELNDDGASDGRGLFDVHWWREGNDFGSECRSLGLRGLDDNVNGQVSNNCGPIIQLTREIEVVADYCFEDCNMSNRNE